MPLYEYECQQCHRRLEKIQKFSDALLTLCPHCGGELEQTITAPAIQFKGAGWYKDLYSSPKPAAASGSGESAAPATASESSPSSGGSGASGGESKPATSAASAPASVAGAASSGS